MVVHTLSPTYALFFGLIVLVLIIGGAQLLLVGGSPYYLLFGLALLLSVVLLWRGRREGAAESRQEHRATDDRVPWKAGKKGPQLVRMSLELVRTFFELD